MGFLRRPQNLKKYSSYFRQERLALCAQQHTCQKLKNIFQNKCGQVVSYTLYQKLYKWNNLSYKLTLKVIVELEAELRERELDILHKWWMMLMMRQTSSSSRAEFCIKEPKCFWNRQNSDLNFNVNMVLGHTYSTVNPRSKVEKVAWIRSHHLQLQ